MAGVGGQAETQVERAPHPSLPAPPSLPWSLPCSHHVTLVSGTNGSGKSAIMQGLQACLGVSARTTGRASTLTHFIRTGADEARVQVGRGAGARSMCMCMWVVMGWEVWGNQGGQATVHPLPTSNVRSDY